MKKKFIVKALTGYSSEPWLKKGNEGLNFCYKPDCFNDALPFLFDSKEEIFDILKQYNGIIVEIMEVYV
jgi:hypothetical protein